MSELILYGLDETGDAGFSAVLGEGDRSRLRDIAEARLRDWPTVEIWDGPMCVVRLRRTKG